MKNDDPRMTNDLTLELPSSPRENRVVHTQNSVKRERPQNKYLKPFKSREELGGELDRRINVGGRPKGMSKAYTRWLAEVDPATGESNADKLAKAQIARACNPEDPGSTAAAREIRQATEGDEIAASSSAISLNPDILRIVQEAARACEQTQPKRGAV